MSKTATETMPDECRSLTPLTCRAYGEHMARSPRVQIPGGIYHVTTRGNRRQEIFKTDEDRQCFLNLLAGVVPRFGWRCHAYCLMRNHYHVLIETPEANLSAGMHLLNGRYAQLFNETHQLDGHLFQGRFRSALVESNWHLIQLSRYIVLNPVRAVLCPRPDDWRWSSYRAATAAEPVPTFLTIDWLLVQFDHDAVRARESFQEFVDAALLPRP